MSDIAAARVPPAPIAAPERGFTQLAYQLNDYPGPTKTALFGIQHVYLSPGTGRSVVSRANGNADGFVLPPEATLTGLERDELVVYAVGGERLKNTLRYPPAGISGFEVVAK